MNQGGKFESKAVTVVIIGGFVFNLEPISILSQLNAKVKFIDINSFAAPFDLNDITQQISQIISPIGNQVIIIGYSTGGLVAMNLAINMPKLVSKMVLINSTPCFLNKDDWNGIYSTDFSRLKQKIDRLSLEQFKDHFSCLSAYPNVYKLNQLRKWQSSFCTKENLINWMQIIAMTDLRQQLNQIDIQVLTIYSELDHLVPRFNNIENTVFTKYILNKSSHVALNHLDLIKSIEDFIL